MPKFARSRYVGFDGVPYSVRMDQETNVVYIETASTAGGPVPSVVLATGIRRDGGLVERRGDLPAEVFTLAEQAAIVSLGAPRAPRPHRLNVSGDFYVEAGCCTRCAVPWTEAPKLFADHDDGCYVRKQPDGDAELASMLEVFRLQDLGCVRYSGRDAAVLRTLTEMGEAAQCDFADPAGKPPAA
jgi:hypothetical protein